jgi:hypothetical protein
LKTFLRAVVFFKYVKKQHGGSILVSKTVLCQFNSTATTVKKFNSPGFCFVFGDKILCRQSNVFCQKYEVFRSRNQHGALAMAFELYKFSFWCEFATVKLDTNNKFRQKKASPRRFWDRQFKEGHF